MPWLATAHSSFVLVNTELCSLVVHWPCQDCYDWPELRFYLVPQVKSGWKKWCNYTWEKQFILSISVKFILSIHGTRHSTSFSMTCLPKGKVKIMCIRVVCDIVKEMPSCQVILWPSNILTSMCSKSWVTAVFSAWPVLSTVVQWMHISFQTVTHLFLNTDYQSSWF